MTLIKYSILYLIESKFYISETINYDSRKMSNYLCSMNFIYTALNLQRTDKTAVEGSWIVVN